MTKIEKSKKHIEENKKQIANLKNTIQTFEKAMENPKCNREYFETQVKLCKRAIEALRDENEQLSIQIA